jgi:ATP-binding cassette subfamily B protein
MGYDTVIGEKGARVSGGEKQRLSIARALIKDSPILILDEATAFIDPENEALIQDAINKLIHNKTLIVIAHRISTIIAADEILVLDKGRIAASGTHEQLLAGSTLYKNMWEAHVFAQDWTLSRKGKND